MSSTKPLLARVVMPISLALACLAPLAAAHAQAAPPPADAPREQLDPKQNQKIERIHVEDSGAKVDELRVGGRTQTITVQPKADVPAYQVLPDNGTRLNQGQTDNSMGASGPRVWNVLKF
ncbi:MAG: hypothetical protein KKC79_14825 [Gammaproteobacteria bacterium]|nr:hypothetical protein [Gammaproteobacteria bacterium]MBU1441509.1 hypothetical protein [Gammaproteobacteria bacterium]MBU2286317.1 hypothetical protein [Gammaproteobacteria bacterium]MBU2409909.1 hypothetical protein [Gammaproteobacteria bacterium]